jgi:tripartite-type tricarboxylate transporter receptor subunit TctC
MTRPCLAHCLAAIFALTCMAGAGRAQSWPSKPVRVIVPITAGSAIDIVARATAQHLSKEFGQPFVVENRPGAGTTIGIAAAASAPPDGYTILFASTALTTTPTTVANIPYNVMRDLVPIAPLTNTPLVMATTQGKYRALSDLVAAAKAGKGSMNYATNGYGSASHFTTERFRLAAGFEAQPVTFRGTPEAITEILADRIAFYFSPMTTVQSLVTEGKLDAMAVTSRKRSVALPNVPTTIEAGYPNSDFDFWVGLFAPAKTPPEIVQRLYRETRKISESPEFRKQMAAIGGEPLEPMTQAEFSAYVGAEIKRNAEIAQAAGLKPQ